MRSRKLSLELVELEDLMETTSSLGSVAGVLRPETADIVKTTFLTQSASLPKSFLVPLLQRNMAEEQAQKTGVLKTSFMRKAAS